MIPSIVKSTEIALPRNLQKTAKAIEKSGLTFVTGKVGKNVKVGLTKDHYNFARFESPVLPNASVEKGALGSGKDLASALTNLLEKLSGKKIFFEGAKETKINMPSIK